MRSPAPWRAWPRPSPALAHARSEVRPDLSDDRADVALEIGRSSGGVGFAQLGAQARGGRRQLDDLRTESEHHRREPFARMPAWIGADVPARRARARRPGPPVEPREGNVQWSEVATVSREQHDQPETLRREAVGERHSQLDERARVDADRAGQPELAVRATHAYGRREHRVDPA